MDLDLAITSIPSLQWMRSLLWRSWHGIRLTLVRIGSDVISVIRPLIDALVKLYEWIRNGLRNGGAVEHLRRFDLFKTSISTAQKSALLATPSAVEKQANGDVNVVVKLRKSGSRRKSSMRSLRLVPVVQASVAVGAMLVLARLAMGYWRQRAQRRDSERQQQMLRGHPVQGFMLPDGRWLAYETYGSKQATHRVVFFFHSLCSSRLERHPQADVIAKSLNLLVICVDRPGYGRSSTHEGRTYMTFAEDISILAQGLGISRYTVCGVGAGGPYALACALLNDRNHARQYSRRSEYEFDVQQSDVLDSNTSVASDTSDSYSAISFGIEESNASLALPSRSQVVTAAVLSSDMPFSKLPKDNLSNYLKDAWFLTQKVPSFVLRLFLHEEMYASVFSEPERYTESLMRDADKLYPHEGPDLETYMDTCVEQMREGMVVNGVQEPVNELIMARRNWGFDLDEVSSTPVHVWHGKKDKLVPMKLVRQCFERLAQVNWNVTLFEVPKKGHFFYLDQDYWTQVFEHLSESFDLGID